MPAVFLSYAREDLSQAREIADQLAAQGIATWRDRDQLRVGQSWPSVLGDAIADSDALVLLWSARAAYSDFVKHEWSTALALKKPVLPCCLDQTPLPAALSAIEAVQPDEIAQAARRVGQGLRSEAARPRPAQSGLRTLLARATLAVGLIAAIALGVRLLSPKAEQPIAGMIQDDATNEPVAGVNVAVFLDGKVRATGVTGSRGHYSFEVAARREADVTLIAQKDGYQTEKRYSHLGNSGLNFKMRRKEE